MNHCQISGWFSSDSFSPPNSSLCIIIHWPWAITCSFSQPNSYEIGSPAITPVSTFWILCCHGAYKRETKYSYRLHVRICISSAGCDLPEIVQTQTTDGEVKSYLNLKEYSVLNRGGSVRYDTSTMYPKLFIPKNLSVKLFLTAYILQHIQELEHLQNE